MELKKTIHCTEELLKKLKALAETHGGSADTELDKAIGVYLKIRDLPKDSQKRIFDLLREPGKSEVNGES